MPNQEIEEFAKILVQQVRDLAIQSCDSRLQPHANHVIAKRWKETLPDGNIDPVAKVLIPDVVDNAIFYLLLAIDNGHLQLSFTASNGKVVSLPEDGELAGWYMGSGGWRKMYSDERFVDDFSDLA